jgi:putative transposase
MGKKRRQHSREFKARVALEALKETNTLGELSARHQVHSVQITQWKKQLKDGAPLCFERGAGKGPVDEQRLTAPLYEEIGRLKMEVDFLKKKC